MPPEATIVAAAVTSNAPTTSRDVAAPRCACDGARTSPEAPVTVPSAVTSAVTRWRGRIVTRPSASARSTSAWNGATIPGPVPHVMWKRGTEFPGPVAV